MKIRRVTDLRTGQPHPARDTFGRFITRKHGALAARSIERWEHERTATHMRWVRMFWAGERRRGAA